LSSCTTYNDFVFYFIESKQLAKDAAASKALGKNALKAKGVYCNAYLSAYHNTDSLPDCFAYRDCNGVKPPMRCLDAPYLKGKAPPLPSLPHGLTLPTCILSCQKQSSNNATIIGPSPATKNDTALNAQPKKVLLNTWYLTYWRRIKDTTFKLSHPSENIRLPDKDSFATWSNLQVKGKATIKLFTSVFTCQWSGERFLSGKLVDKQMQYLEQNFQLGVPDTEEGVETKALVWYRKSMCLFVFVEQQFCV
jgi:hypothetical protein